MGKGVQRAIKAAQKGHIGAHPKKRLYRARAHSNPFNDAQFAVPLHPKEVNWSEHYPAFFGADGTPRPSEGGEPAAVRFLDIGCGFGGLLIRLSPLFQDKLILGIEIRDKVTAYVQDRIQAQRKQLPGQFENVSCMRNNAMRYLPNFFGKGQLEKMFFLFPDPHFKLQNHRRRIIQRALLAEYAYVLKLGGLLYTITDVQELADWMRSKLDEHPLFERVSDEELATDVAAQQLMDGTEEGQKVARNSGKTWRSIYRRIDGPQRPVV